MTCFQSALSEACSSFRDCWSCVATFMTPVILMTLRRGDTLSLPKSDPGFDRGSSKPSRVGDRIGGDMMELLESLLDRGGRGSLAKKPVTKAYSAVALSMSTINADRTRASRGSFYTNSCRQSPQTQLYNHAGGLCLHSSCRQSSMP